jgi:hypothetical protein
MGDYAAQERRVESNGIREKEAVTNRSEYAGQGNPLVGSFR